MLGVLDAGEIERVLHEQHIGRLGVYGEGEVYIFPLAYGYDGRYIYAHSHEGLKVTLMRAHPRVCFEVEAIVSPAEWRTVMVHGVFEEVTEDDERVVALAAIARQGTRLDPPSVAPYVGGPEGLVVYRIRPTEKTGRFEKDGLLTRTGQQWTLTAI